MERSKYNIMLRQGCTNPWRQVARVIKFFKVEPNNLWVLSIGLATDTLHKLKILRWLLDFLKTCALLFTSYVRFVSSSSVAKITKHAKLAILDLILSSANKFQQL